MMQTFAAGAQPRPGLLGAVLATAILASSLGLAEAYAGPKPDPALTDRAVSERVHSTPLADETAIYLPTGAGQMGRALGRQSESAKRGGGHDAPGARLGAAAAGPAGSLALIVEPRDAGELKGALERIGFRLDRVRAGEAEVPRVYVAALPPDLREVSQVDTRKRLFLRSVLPLVLLANEEIAQRRARMLDLVGRLEAGREVAVADRAWLDALAEHYEAEHGDFETLKRRVAEIPPSLALAQAIVESGWGTSRFALEGNALFGQRVWSDNAEALVPERNRAVRVKAFLDLMESVRAYMHNLNTHPAYADLRAERARLAAAGAPPAGARLVYGLEDYAELEGYVAKLKELMRHNRLAELDGARLQSRPLTALTPPRR